MTVQTEAVEPAATRNTVLIVAHTITFLTELSLFGKLLRERTGAETIFYCPFVHRTAQVFAENSAREGITCLLPPVRESLVAAGFPLAEPPVMSSSQKLSSLFSSSVSSLIKSLAVSRIKRALGSIVTQLPSVGAGFVAEQRSLAASASEVAEMLSAIKPRLIVLGGDMVGYDTPVYVKVGHEHGIPTLVVPSTMSNGLEQAEVYYGDPDYHVKGWEGALISWLFPKWVRQHKDKRLFRCPPGRLVALEFAGLAPPQPWIFNSGAADAIAMESPAMIDYYAEAGMKNDRMILTGTLSDDAMAARMSQARQLRERLCAELGFDPSQPLILTALPPDFLYVNGGRPLCDFQRYEDIVEFWIGSIAELKGCNCIVALHPIIDIESMRHIERDNVRIGTWKTADMVPTCDIYVASISSTIRWAIGCGKPVVNYDVYRYRYTDFLSVPGVLATEEKDEYRSILRRLAEDVDHRNEIASRQAGLASYWGMLDGHVGDRMLDVVHRLCGLAQSTSSTTAATRPAARQSA